MFQEGFLKSTDGNFLTEVIEEPTMGNAVLDTMQGPWDVKLRGSTGCNDRETVVAFFPKSRFWLLQECALHCMGLQELHRITRIAWDTAPEKTGVQESWLIFRDHLLEAPQCSISICRKLNSGSRRPT